MLSFRVDEEEARALRAWAERLGTDRSQLLRDALHQHLAQLASREDARRYEEVPLTPDERALARVADWGPAEDWSDWA
ncbi:MAG: ribbon-helix-helix domain-containing protein [Acidimicrobiia bacterium]|nr:ribbon-helix-helix domain-containing protein [Acidimicrobiia bacterium]